MPALLGSPIRARTAAPYFAQRGRANVLTCALEIAGETATASAAAIRILDRAGTEHVNATGTTPAGVPTYTWTPTTDTPLSEGWSVEWTVTVGGTVYVVRRTLHVVRYELACPIGVQDLLRIAPQLDPDGDAPLSTYDVERLDGFVDEAWAQIQSDLLARGRRPQLVSDAYTLRTVALHHALMLIWRSLSHSQAPQITDAAAAHERDLAAAWKITRLDYEEDELLTRPNARRGTIWLAGR